MNSNAHRSSILRRHGLEEKWKQWTPEIARLIAARERRRRRLAALPFPEKVRAIVRLQQMALPLLRARGKKVNVWRIDD